MTTTTSISTGNAQDISGTGTANAATGSTTLSLSEVISSKIAPYLERADTVASQINTNTTLIASYKEMQTLLSSLQTASSNLTTESLQGTNVFNKRSATMTSTSTASSGTPSDASTLMSVTVKDSTTTGSHTIVVNQVAQAEVDVSATLSNTATISSLGLTAGTFVIGEAGKTAATITVSSTDTLSSIASSINNSSSTTGVSASIVAVSSTQSVLVLSAADDDTAIQMTDTSGVLAGIGVVKTAAQSDAQTSTSAALGFSGSFQLTSGGPTITVTSTESLSDIENAINTAYSSGSYTQTVTATLDSLNRISLSVSSGSLTYTDLNSGSVLANLGFGDSKDQVQKAQAASLTVDGVAGITRSNNSISDVVSGVTFNLKASDANTKVTVTIGQDTTSVASAIGSFVTAYNTWQNFVTTNEKTNSDGTAASTAVLFGDSTLRSISLDLDNEISSMALGISSSSVNVNLAAIGLSLDSSNLLEIDTTTLASQLTSNFSQVAALFANTVSVNTSSASSGTTLKASGSNLSTASGTFTFVYVNGSLSVTDATGDAVTGFSVSNGTISGNSGTAYAGLDFVFTGTGTLGTVSVTEGLANQVFASAKNYGDSATGSVQNLITNLQNEDTSLQTQYNTLMSEAQNYATFLTNQYATLSAQIQASNQTLVTLKALVAAGNNSSSS